MSSSLLSRLRTRTETVYGPDGQFDGVRLAPFTIDPGTPRGELYSALQAVERICQPAKERDIVPVVATLKARTKSRAEGEGEARFTAATMTRDLSRYPLDVVVFACDYWIDGGRDAIFFPSWAELKEICDKRMDGRLRLRRALEWAHNEAMK